MSDKAHAFKRRQPRKPNALESNSPNSVENTCALLDIATPSSCSADATVASKLDLAA